MPKKILFINDAMNEGGTERLLIDIAKNLDKTKFELSLATLRPGCWDSEIDGYVKDHYYLQKLDANGDFVGMKRFSRYFPARSYEKITTVFDTVVVFKQLYFNYASLVKAIKYLLWVHEDYAYSQLYNNKKGVTEKFFKAYKIIYIKSKFAVIICAAPNASESYKAYFKCNKTKVIMNACDFEVIERKAAEKQPFEFDKSLRYITTISGMGSNKNVDMTVRAFAKTYRKYKDIKLLIGGSCKAEGYQKVKEEIELNEIGHAVVFLGHVDNPYYYMKNSYLFVTPSFMEAFGLTTVEAMHLGCPVLSCDNRGVRNIIKNNFGGYVCDANEEAFTDALEKIVENPEYRDSLAENSQKAVECFGFNNYMKQVEEIL